LIDSVFVVSRQHEQAPARPLGFEVDASDQAIAEQEGSP
jgi:hypothetical protein